MTNLLGNKIASRKAHGAKFLPENNFQRILASSGNTAWVGFTVIRFDADSGNGIQEGVRKAGG
jgi:hypothetical protein